MIQWFYHTLQFQLTTSRRGRPPIQLGHSITVQFQLTTSRRGRHVFSLWSTTKKLHFNSRPHEEVDPRHLPEWESDRNNFNSRPHEEVDNLCIWESSLSLLISTHDLTKRSTICRSTSCRGEENFNSRPHEEVDKWNVWKDSRQVHFNSRPHEEVDPFLLYLLEGFCISTHDLTKRSTRRVHKSAVSSMYFNSRPHEEVDISTRWGHFYFGKFQLTTSRRGRQSTADAVQEIYDISTHDLTKRSTDDPEGEPEEKPFQLTTSRRGRHGCLKHNWFCTDISTHDLTKRSTKVSVCIPSISWYFNSRPHEEVDNDSCAVSTTTFNISTHDLTKRSTS